MSFPDNVWWTRKARIQTEKRLLSNAFQTQVLLLWYSFVGVAVSIYYLKTSNLEQDIQGIAWVIYSVLVLVIAGFINGLSFKERAALVKECYETLNALYHKARSNQSHDDSLTTEYEQILGVCENHTEVDYFKALCQEYLTNSNPKDANTGLDRHPTLYHWLVVGWALVKRIVMFLLLYSLPIILFLMLEHLY